MPKQAKTIIITTVYDDGSTGTVSISDVKQVTIESHSIPGRQEDGWQTLIDTGLVTHTVIGKGGSHA